jgi:exodeoxyribonuclease VII small subunit
LSAHTVATILRADMARANESSDEASDGTEAMSLEKILERLGHVVDRLEKGDLPLEQLMSMFEEGVRLKRAGEHRLDAAQARIEALLSTDAGAGEPATQTLPQAPGAR